MTNLYAKSRSCIQGSISHLAVPAVFETIYIACTQILSSSSGERLKAVALKARGSVEGNARPPGAFIAFSSARKSAILTAIQQRNKLNQHDIVWVYGVSFFSWSSKTKKNIFLSD